MREEFPNDLVGWAAIRSKVAEDRPTGKNVRSTRLDGLVASKTRHE